jgi:hypothetical protein
MVTASEVRTLEIFSKSDGVAQHTVTRLWAGRRGYRGSILCRGKKFFFLQTAQSKYGNQSFTQWIKGAVPVVSGRPKLKTNHLPQTGAEIKNSLSYTSYPPYDTTTRVSVRCRVEFIFYFFSYLRGISWPLQQGLPCAHKIYGACVFIFWHFLLSFIAR